MKMNEQFEVYPFVVSVFNTKWHKKTKKEKTPNFHIPGEDEEKHHQAYRNRFFLELLKNDPWEDKFPEKATLEFTERYFRQFKDFF